MRPSLPARLYARVTLPTLGTVADRLGLGCALYAAVLAGGSWTPLPRPSIPSRLPAGLASLLAALGRRRAGCGRRTGTLEHPNGHERTADH